MFIIWGYRTVKSKLRQAPELTCPACGNNHSVQIQYYQEYFHTMWIPFFPSGREGYMICPQCGHVGDLKEIKDKSYRDIYKKHRPGILKWTWIGLLVSGALALFIFIGSFSQMMEKENRIKEMADTCKKEVAAGKIYQVGVSDDYLIDPLEKSPSYAKVIMIESVSGNTISYYEGRIVGRTYENMFKKDVEQQIETKVVKQISVDDFNKLRVIRCR